GLLSFRYPNSNDSWVDSGSRNPYSNRKSLMDLHAHRWGRSKPLPPATGLLLLRPTQGVPSGLMGLHGSRPSQRLAISSSVMGGPIFTGKLRFIWTVILFFQDGVVMSKFSKAAPKSEDLFHHHRRIVTRELLT